MEFSKWYPHMLPYQATVCTYNYTATKDNLAVPMMYTVVGLFLSNNSWPGNGNMTIHHHYKFQLYTGQPT